MLRILVYLLKYNFHFNKNWIFAAIYVIQKLKTKNMFLPNFESKNMFPR